ncbi:MAG TPA: hypothetical protein VM118_11130, partial [Acidobacteriota bacterium]|nr:hypothetical protein [Acidobacteriota bacterium]
DLDTMPSPGIPVGITSYDSQHNAAQGHQIVTNPGSNTVHFAWTMWDILPSAVDETNRFVSYNSWDRISGTLNQGDDGTPVSLGEFARGGFVRIDVDSDNLCRMTFHQRIEESFPYSAWFLDFPIEGSVLHLDQELTKPPAYLDEQEHLWPDIAVEQNSASGDVMHIIAMGGSDGWVTRRIWYWRYDDGAPWPHWEGPVLIDSSRDLSYTIDAADDSSKVAIAFTSSYSTDGYNSVNNVAYRESRTGGAGWLSGAELGEINKNFATTFNDPDGPQAWTETSTAYDHHGTLHIIFTVQPIANQTEQMAIFHWSNERGTMRRVTAAYYDNPGTWGRLLNLGQISLGIGNGTTSCRGGTELNEDYLYTLYTKLGGATPEEQADMSALGYSNGELYLCVSMDGGDNWSVPVNLTNTKTPGCHSSDAESVCASEAWATIARDVSDIEILYILDFEPSAFDEAPWSMNRAMYLNYPGGTIDAPYLCPSLQSVFASDLTIDTACEYHAPPGWMNTETLTIWNHGNIPMYGDVSVTAGADWLSVDGDGPYTIGEGDSLTLPVTMSAVGLTPGLYVGNIQVTHDDPAAASPVDYPIAFYVADEFYCPEDQILRTAVAGQGVLSLQVGTDGRFGHPSPYGGLWRSPDKSSAIYDASLVIAHGTQGPDTVVFHRFYERPDPGQYGFRSLAPLSIDTSAYGSGAGYALATAEMTTGDSILDVRAAWFLPQNPDSADFVITRYTVSNPTALPVDNIAVGVWADLNVVVGTGWLTQYQDSTANHGYFHAPLNLLYQYGYDDLWHTPDEYLETSERYSGGITYIAGRRYATDGLPFELEEIPLRGGILDIREYLPDGGPTSGLLYDHITGDPGVPVYEPYPADSSGKNLYTYLTLDQGLTLAPGEEQVYIIGLVSDTLEHYAYGPAPTKSFGASSLDDVVHRAWDWAAANAFCACPCRSDPQCDGITNVLDVVLAVDVAFRSQSPTSDPGCPFPRTDVTCDRITNVLDVVHFVNVAFRGGEPANQFCEECP